jgi:poly(3-hydroxybutyrate) depolymerase
MMMNTWVSKLATALAMLLVVSLANDRVRHQRQLSSDGIQNHASANLQQSSELRHEPQARRRRRLSWLFPQIDDYGGVERSFRHDGLRRYFMEYQPNNMPKQNAALVVQLHWATGNMRSSQYLGRIVEKDPWLELSKIEGFLVLCPNGTQKRTRYKFLGELNTRGFKQEWNDILGVGPAATGADDVGFIAKLVEWAIRERNVDPKRVYITGISAGGLMSYRMIIERSGLFAGAAVIGANLPLRNLTMYTVPTPIFIMSGTNDTRMPYEGRNDGGAKGRGGLRSAEATRDFFVAANKASPNATTINLPNIDPNDDCTVVSQYYPSDTAPVQFYCMNGGGHVPAGKTYKLAEKYVVDDLLGQTCHDVLGIPLAWEFMSKFPSNRVMV